MSRVEGWEERLAAVLSSHASSTYAWGQADCVAMARDAVEAITGKRPPMPANYSTERGAALAMRRLGYARLGDAVAALFPERPAGHAKRGDIAVIETQAGDTLAIVVGENALWKSEAGGRFFPVALARVVYAVD